MKEFFLRYSSINVWSFFWKYLAYSVLSSFLFISTTGGFTLLGVAILCFFGFGTIFTILLITLIIKSIKSIKEVNIFYNIFYFILIPCQVVLLFLSPSDCGDSPCRNGYDSNFLRRLFFPDMGSIYDYSIYDFRVLFQILYVTTLCFVFLSPLLTKRSNLTTS